MDKISISEKLNQFTEHWSPKIIGELNGQYVKLVKCKGEFLWHHHEVEDEMFLIVKGTLRMLFRDHEVILKEGECIIIPAGTEHKPVATEEVHVLLFEPKSTLNTGNVTNERTRKKLDSI
ncbi:MAG: cupin domain-containing protein [Bacteroidota bacterium]